LKVSPRTGDIEKTGYYLKMSPKGQIKRRRAAALFFEDEPEGELREIGKRIFPIF
jgi:hypothetical protein